MRAVRRRSAAVVGLLVLALAVPAIGLAANLDDNGVAIGAPVPTVQPDPMAGVEQPDGKGSVPPVEEVRSVPQPKVADPQPAGLPAQASGPEETVEGIDGADRKGGRKDKGGIDGADRKGGRKD